MEKCKKCGGINFMSDFITRVYFDLKDGILTPTEEDKQGMEDVIFCCNCDKEYSPSDFKEIL